MLKSWCVDEDIPRHLRFFVSLYAFFCAACMCVRVCLQATLTTNYNNQVFKSHDINYSLQLSS